MGLGSALRPHRYIRMVATPSSGTCLTVEILITGGFRDFGAQVHEDGGHALPAHLGRLVDGIVEEVVVRLVLLAVHVVQDLQALAVQQRQLRDARDAPLDLRDHRVLLQQSAPPSAQFFKHNQHQSGQLRKLRDPWLRICSISAPFAKQRAPLGAVCRLLTFVQALRLQPPEIHLLSSEIYIFILLNAAPY